jgi:HK97 family phage major capsid protein/HK97 family phage prohead protease
MERRERASEGTGLDFVISDGSLDRHGTRINPNGWDLTSFNRNPIALFGHRGEFPIGRWENVRVEGGRLMGRLVLAAKGTSARIDELISLAEQGILRAVSVGFSVLEAGIRGKSAYDYMRQDLHEVSLVAVGSNPNALAMARSLNLSSETLSLAFGEHAEGGQGRATAGEQADKPHATEMRAREADPSRPKGKPMTTLSQRIEHAQNDLTAKRDRLTELSGADALDLDAIDALNGEIETAQRTVDTLKATEARIGLDAGKPGTPALPRRPLSAAQREVKGLDLIVRAAVVRGISHFGNKPVAQVLEERYPGHEATAIMTRADQTIGTTGVSGWASEIVQTAYADFLQALQGYSVYPALRSRGIGLSFDGVGTVSIPSRTAGGAGGGFVAEGSPIRVGRITTAATTMTAKKMGVIVPFSRELAKRSTPAIESLVRQAILEDTGVILDAALLDATAADNARPAGLLNGVSAAAAGYGGGDFAAVVEDFKALLAPFYTANAADNITVIMNPAQGLALSMMPGPGDGRFGWAEPLMNRLTIIESTHATAGRLIALRNSDFATAMGDAPEFDVSEQATVHMEDTTPLEIVSGTGPTTADPVRSFFQTATIGVRMLMDVSWKMRRSGMVQWINGTSW